MTGFLLDTHVVLWWFEGRRLSPAVSTMIREPGSATFVSIATVWEVAIKESLGKLRPPENLADVLGAEGMELLPTTTAHTTAVRDLPLLHGDPFDRMLVAQAQVEGLTLVTRDERLRQYDVPSLEA